MQKHYQPEEIEQHWYQHWEQSGYFIPQPGKTPYTIMLPPPNVTGTLHMGHGFQISLMDALIRYHRMRGFSVLWQVGTDHAGIATQMVVERQLLQQGIKRTELGREAFVEKIWQWKDQSDGVIKGQLRRMGASVDWSRERFTMDPEINTAVQKVFIELYQQGLLYKGKRLVNWDPVLRTAISDLEVHSEEESGQLWHIRYPLAQPQGNLSYIVVATTRPETLLGDTAVAVHPEDERYQALIGQQLQHPLTGRLIPIVADTYVDPAFGTGCVKITPAHDFNDFALGQRHQLPVINILTPSAHINELAPAEYQGLERFEARRKIIDDLTALDLIEKIVPHRLMVPRGDRTGAILEPLLTDQWYIKTKPLAEAAIAAVQRGEIQFVPENWRKTYFQWLENIEDWCISRQLWWGHRIPAWYDEAGNVYVGENEAQIRAQHQLSAAVILKQDDDVLDTWVSASLWPFVTLGWPKSTPELQTFYPTQVLVTGFDILFFWVARMVMMGLKFTDQVPFQTVYITGLIRDSEGQKMSKSKGNILDPLDLIEGIDLDSLLAKRTQNLMQPEQAQKIAQATRRDFPEGIPAFGTDALRFTYCALASTGRNINFDLPRVEGYKNFCNKLWNAARFVLMQVEGQTLAAATDLSLPDRWIISRLQATIEAVHQAFAAYRFDWLAQTLYEFIWNAYCDWYLEFSKTTLQDEHTAAATRFTLVSVLETVLRLLHPLMPFITEEIWQRLAPLLGKTGSTIMLEPYPELDTQKVDAAVEADVAWLQKIILSIRQIRSEMQIAPGKRVTLILYQGTEQDRQRIQHHQAILMNMARLSDITWLPDAEKPPAASATALVDQLELYIPLEAADTALEQQRLEKEIQKIMTELAKVQTKLANPDYVQKAPAAVVEKERAKQQELEQARGKLQERLEKMKK
ncbi:MAG: valine--tRNA ligase [Gammaproteobacteria bacterium]